MELYTASTCIHCVPGPGSSSRSNHDSSLVRRIFNCADCTPEVRCCSQIAGNSLAGPRPSTVNLFLCSSRPCPCLNATSRFSTSCGRNVARGWRKQPHLDRSSIHSMHMSEFVLCIFATDPIRSDVHGPRAILIVLGFTLRVHTSGNLPCCFIRAPVVFARDRHSDVGLYYLIQWCYALDRGEQVPMINLPFLR